MFTRRIVLPTAILFATAGVIALTGCGGPAPSTASAPSADSAAVLAAREQELAAREAELARKEAEQQGAEAARLAAEEAAQAERDAAAQAAAAASASAAASKPRPAKPAATASKPAQSSSTSSLTVKPAPVPLLIPAGTNLTVALTSALSSKTAKVGDTFDALVVSDVLVGDRVAVPAGSHVAGTITNVISGSNKIGGVPALGLRFDSLQLAGGQKLGISGELTQQGRSDTGRDTAKILGGAAAGAVIGHQVDNSDKGTVIGGLLGGAAGAIAAKKTGAEVELPQDSTLTIALGAPLEVPAR